MNDYEMMLIVKANADESVINATAESLKEVITSMKGEITKEDKLGNKELAYPIKKELTGYYFVYDFKADTDLVNELDRKAKIDENVIRHMIIRLDEE